MSADNLDELVAQLREQSPSFLIDNREQVRHTTSSSNTFVGDSFGALVDAGELVVDVVSGIGEVIGDILSAIAEG